MEKVKKTTIVLLSITFLIFLVFGGIIPYIGGVLTGIVMHHYISEYKRNKEFW